MSIIRFTSSTKLHQSEDDSVEKIGANPPDGHEQALRNETRPFFERTPHCFGNSP